jgi:hypothetical protein
MNGQRLGRPAARVWGDDEVNEQVTAPASGAGSGDGAVNARMNGGADPSCHEPASRPPASPGFDLACIATGRRWWRTARRTPGGRRCVRSGTTRQLSNDERAAAVGYLEALTETSLTPRAWNRGDDVRRPPGTLRPGCVPTIAQPAPGRGGAGDVMGWRLACGLVTTETATRFLTRRGGVARVS